MYRNTLCILLISLFLTSCATATETTLQPTTNSRNIPTLFPTKPGLTPTNAPQPAENTPDSGWMEGASGIELRKINADLGDRIAKLSVARLDPALVRLHVGYSPGKPLTWSAWLDQTHPLLLVNGGYFEENFHTTSLLISDGTAFGETYVGFGGMLSVDPNGAVDLFPLRDQPYNPEKPAVQAMQSFPMLVFPGGVDSGVVWNAERARRTALAIDRSGRLLVIISSNPAFSLNEFADWLRASDLDIDRAVNLDGGPSTGMQVDAGAAQERIEPFSRLPIVLYAVEM